MGISFHAKPYCWGKLNKSQDEIKNYHFPIVCPHCHIQITNEEVAEPWKLGDFVSLIKVDKDSKVVLF